MCVCVSVALHCCLKQQVTMRLPATSKKHTGNRLSSEGVKYAVSILTAERDRFYVRER